MYHFPDCCPFQLNASSNPLIRQLPAAPGAISTAPIVRAIANPTNTTFNTPYQQSLPPICRDFNSRSCSRLNYAFRHVCELCTGRHPKRACSTLPLGQPATHPRLMGCMHPTTPLRPLILECELSNHPDKASVKLLLSDIRLGCNIGYTDPQFAYTAKNLQSSLIHSSILDDALQCMRNHILGPLNSPPCLTYFVQVWGLYPSMMVDGEPSTTFLHIRLKYK